MLKCHVTPEEWQWKVCDGKSKPWAGHEEALRSVPCTYHHKGPVTRIDLTRLPKDSSAQEACLNAMHKLLIYPHWKRISELHWKQKKKKAPRRFVHIDPLTFVLNRILKSKC